jgi:hypothetical protein
MINEPYMKVHNMIEKGEQDPNKATVTVSFQAFIDIGKGLKEVQHHLLQQKKCAPEIESHFNRLEHMLKETITTTVKKTYASAIATPEAQTRARAGPERPKAVIKSQNEQAAQWDR